MKTNEFIELLRKEDPEGEAEVVYGGSPIYYVERLPGYYDGAYSILIQDHSKDPYYNIIGIKHTRVGTKLCLKVMNTEDILCDNPEAIVELDPSLGEFRLKAMEESVRDMRIEYRQLAADIAKAREERERGKDDSTGKS